VRATLETLQAGIDKLRQVIDTLCLTTETVAKVEHQLRQENTELARQLETVRLNTEAIARKEEVLAKNEEELARQLDSVRLNTQAMAKDEHELRQENTEIRAGIDNLKQGVDAVRLNTEAIAKNEYQLRQENAELRSLAERGFLRFATRVDADDFRAFAAIMLMGFRSHAAEALGVAQSSLYARVDAWAFRGGDYKRMYLMIEWRKKTARKIKVRLDDSLLGTEVEGQAENPETARDVLAAMRDKTDEMSRDDLLRDILQALCSQNADNWESVRDELIQILKAEVPE
jgi:hypothetical protein